MFLILTINKQSTTEFIGALAVWNGAGVGCKYAQSHTGTHHETRTDHTDMLSMHRHTSWDMNIPYRYAQYAQAQIMRHEQTIQICSVHTSTPYVIVTVHTDMVCTHKHTLCYRDSPYRYGLYTQTRLMLQGQSIQIWSVHTSTPCVTGTVHANMLCTHKHALCYRDSPCKYALYTQAHLML